MSADAAPGISAPRSRRTLTIVAVVLIGVALAGDPVARRALSDGRIVELGVLQLKLAYNSGVAFSVGNQLPPWVIIAVTAIITVGIGVYAWRTVPTGSPLGTVGLSAIVAGAAAMIGTITGAISRWLWVAGYAIGVPVMLITGSPILGLILLLGLFTIYRTWKSPVRISLITSGSGVADLIDRLYPVADGVPLDVEPSPAARRM